MGKLIKLGTGKPGVRTKRGTPTDWYCKIKLGPYEQRRARLCTDASMSESWAVLLQAAVDRKNGGEPPDADAMKKLPRRLLESFGLVSELSAKRRGTFLANVEDYERELQRPLPPSHRGPCQLYLVVRWRCQFASRRPRTTWRCLLIARLGR